MMHLDNSTPTCKTLATPPFITSPNVLGPRHLVCNRVCDVAQVVHRFAILRAGAGGGEDDGGSFVGCI